MFVRVAGRNSLLKSSSFAILFVCLSVCLFLCLLVRVLVCFFICLFVFLFLCLFLCLLVCSGEQQGREMRVTISEVGSGPHGAAKIFSFRLPGGPSLISATLNNKGSSQRAIIECDGRSRLCSGRLTDFSAPFLISVVFSFDRNKL